ncbi:Cytoskeleton protein RodZ [Candidatus Erwinia haradaeae]|uniref:Cytoskeleton protein RodZ, partial n=1 Tax=Candidatus Erwinia haradaeae TaxID=1922217 RepID=A0A451DKQ5_9GAMM|nr:helix-turn-helix domain-containing protein [Candidatus Erwinia haradaeae]VFP87312.1 Cytoskeleton protein RodZ [Candidatus Erwinia haradaeae]
MNTDNTQNIYKVTSAGERLRSARENLGFTQQYVAKRLCLKISVIRDIEDDNVPASLALTFLRGYIRSYARLVRIPGEELISIIDQRPAIKELHVSIMKSYSLDKHKKQRERLLIICIWLAVFCFSVIIIVCFWQNNTATQDNTSFINSQHTENSMDNH